MFLQKKLESVFYFSTSSKSSLPSHLLLWFPSYPLMPFDLLHYSPPAFSLFFQETPPQTESQTQSHSQLKGDLSRLAPRLCHLVRSENGYGFNLHSDRSRPGQYIRSLDPGSPADRAGLHPQDRLIEVGLLNNREPSINNNAGIEHC